MSSAEPGWRPVLEEDLAEHALDCAEEIAADLRRIADSVAGAEELPLNRIRFSLGGGLAGQALFFAYLDRVRPGQGYDESAIELLEEAFDELGRTDAMPGLCSGIAGVAWTVEHLRGWLVDLDGEDSGDEVAAALARILDASSLALGYDLVSGLVGLGVYALERLPRPQGQPCLERVVARLAAQAERGPEGVAWWTPPDRMTPQTLKAAPDGMYDLGIAHGIPGVIAWLGAACASGVAPQESRPLLAAAVAWLLAQQNPPGAPNRFPAKIIPGQELGTTRVAWCYGDLGIAVALLGAARGAGEPAWERTALDLARGAAARPVEDAGVVDAGLCHGAAGNAHLFNRLFQGTGDPVLGEAARIWAERALAMRRPGEGIGGFLALVPDARLERGWNSDPSFLTGAAGVGLALLAAASPVEPAWDRALLCGASPIGLKAEPLRHFPGVPASGARALPLVLLAGFGDPEAAELRLLLEGDCRVATAQSLRETRLALQGKQVAVFCLGRLLSPVEARALLAGMPDSAGGSPLVLLTAAGPDPALFQDLIDEDRLFYLSQGELPPRELSELVRSALERRRRSIAEEPAAAGLRQALWAARRVAAQPDPASAGELLQLAVEEAVETDRAYCLLYDAAGEVLWSRATGLESEERYESAAVGLVSFVARTGRPVRVERATEDPRYEREADDPLGGRCEHLLAQPVRAPEPDGRVLAVLCAVRDPGRAPFSAADEVALELLAATVAPSLAQLELAARLEAEARLVDRELHERTTEIFREEAVDHYVAAGSREGDWLRLSPRWTHAMFWLLVGLVAAFLMLAALVPGLRAVLELLRD